MSGKPTHTPKPWRVEISKSGNLAILGDETHRQQGFAECCICLIAPAGQITPIDHANARLIAAAPDMAEEIRQLKQTNAELLEVLEMIARYPIAGGYALGPCISECDMDEIRAAIAKAKP